tara:strand:+ start:3534 stop:4019 length:486 start_codon:yes stop_codon:yes gene_type:complete
MKNLKYSIILLSIFVIGCTDSNSDAYDSGQIASEVEAVFKAYVDHVNTAGLASVDTFFIDDERFYWVEDGIIQYPDKASLISGLKEFIPQVTSIEMEIMSTKTHVISDEHASFFVRFKEEIALNSGYSFTLDGAITILFEKQGSTWKFLNGHSSVIKPRSN